MDIVKDYLSPDILEKYGPSQSTVQSERDNEGTTEPDNERTVSSNQPSEATGKEEVEGGDEETKEQADSNIEN